jgi:hypothetical protein
MTRHAGLLVEHRGALRFIPVNVAQRIVRRDAISRVVGSELGMTLFEGRVISVIELGSSHRSELVVCDVDGESVALAGLSVLASGFFEAREEGVLSDAGTAPLLDVAAEVRAFERQLWKRDSPAGERT